MFLAVGGFAVGKGNHGELKGRPPPRPVPDDFEVIFVEQGRDGCVGWYRAHKTTVTRWLIECGKKRLIDNRAAFVKHQRANGKWLTRSTKLVEHREIRTQPHSQPIRDRRRVSFTLARHAAQHLRIVRNGGFIVSPTGKGDWWVGTKRLSPAQLVDLAKSKGFDANSPALQDESGEGVN